MHAPAEAKKSRDTLEAFSVKKMHIRTYKPSTLTIKQPHAAGSKLYTKKSECNANVVLPLLLVDITAIAFLQPIPCLGWYVLQPT